MKTNLLTYDHSSAGSTTVLVEVPDIPTRITIFDFPGARVGVSLTTPSRKTVQVGPGDPHGTGVKIRSVDSPDPGAQGFSKVLGASFSQISSSSSSIMQCAGSLSMGLDRNPGLSLIVPKGSFLNMRAHGQVQVYLDDQLMTLGDAVGMSLLDVKYSNEL